MFGRKTLGHILSGFQKTIDELDALADRNSEEVDANVKVINRLRDVNTDLNAETTAANAVRGKIAELIA